MGVAPLGAEENGLELPSSEEDVGLAARENERGYFGKGWGKR